MAFFMCSMHHTTCYQWPLTYKNSIAFEIAYSVGRVQGYTITMYPPQTKTKTLHSTWNGIFYVFCAPHHMLSVTPSIQKLHSIWNGIFGGPCTPAHVNHVPPKQKQKYFIALEMGFFMCSDYPTICYQWPLAYKNSIAFEMAYSVGRVQGYTLTMYPPKQKTKILHSTWNGIFYVFCAPHHMLSVTPSLQILHSIWNGIFGGPCTPVHVNHVPPPPQTKTKILHSTWDGIFYVFCAPHHMLSVTLSLQKLHSIWNGTIGGPCAGVHVNHVPPTNKNKNTS